MNASAELLKELRLERGKPAAPPPSRRVLWIALAVAALLLAALAAWLLLGRDQAVEVNTAPVVAISTSGGASASVLDASGYVVARRMATVSAKVTGRVKEVLIEEGMRVEQGQVEPAGAFELGRLQRLGGGQRAQRVGTRLGQVAALQCTPGLLGGGRGLRLGAAGGALGRAGTGRQQERGQHQRGQRP